MNIEESAEKRLLRASIDSIIAKRVYEYLRGYTDIQCEIDTDMIIDKVIQQTQSKYIPKSLIEKKIK